MSLPLGPAAAARRLADDLRARFDALLEDPRAYARRVPAECGAFPEGDLLPFVFPALAYALDAVDHPARAARNLARIAPLVDAAVPPVARRVRPPGGRLERLADYGQHAVYLGQLALALGAWRLAGGDGRWDALHGALGDVLHEALVRAGGRPLRSFPHATWPFDTVPVLVALALLDRARGDGRSAAAIARHLEWVDAHATDGALGLPLSHLAGEPGGGRVVPRGCDLAYRTWLLAMIDPARARRTYRAFCRHFWIERGVLAGFAEWPHGRSLGQDADSGPVVLGMGLAATGFGIGAARVMGDGWRLGRLLFQLSSANAIFTAVRPVVERHYPFDRRHVTGSLMGDACVFAMAAWSGRPSPVSSATPPGAPPGAPGPFIR